VRLADLIRRVSLAQPCKLFHQGRLVGRGQDQSLLLGTRVALLPLVLLLLLPGALPRPLGHRLPASPGHLRTPLCRPGSTLRRVMVLVRALWSFGRQSTNAAPPLSSLTLNPI